MLHYTFLCDILSYKGGDTMNERIKQIRKDLHLTQTEFGQKIGLSRDAMANIEGGRIEIKDIVLKSICREFGANYDWLVNGTGEMFQDDDSDAQAIVDSVMTGDNEFAKKILVQFARLDESRWRQIEEILNELKKE